MKFCEKLVFLMETTRMNNKSLADAICVDPSMISLLKTGRRGKPRNTDMIRSIADVIAAHVQNPYQRESLADAIGQTNLKYRANTTQLSDSIYKWMADDSYRPPTQLDQLFDAPEAYNPDMPVPLLPPPAPKTNQTLLYYGKEGKGSAIMQFYQILTAQKSLPHTIFLSSDEDNGWFLMYDQLKKDIPIWMNLINTFHVHIVHILPPPTSPSFLDILACWTPLYLTGNVDVYIYPRIRDHVFRRTMLLVDGIVGIFSTSIAGESESPYSVVTQDKALISASIQQFKDYQAKCQKVFNIYTQSKDVSGIFSTFARVPVDYMQFSDTLSSFTMPKECLNLLFPHHSDKDGFYTPASIDAPYSAAYFQDTRYQWFTSHRTIDICYLASADEVKEGKVYQIYPSSEMNEKVPYTVEAYILHLRYIIFLMKSFPEYYFVPSRTSYSFANTIMLKENKHALLIKHDQKNPRLLHLTNPNVIQPFYEHLMDMADRIHYTGSAKRAIIHQLNTLIENLEDIRNPSKYS